MIQRRVVVPAFLFLTLFLASTRPAAAVERLCDPSFQNCRTYLLSLIDNETQGIDIAFWFMEDNTFVQHIVNRWKAGVPIRILVDPRGSASSAFNQGVLNALAGAGIPMRKRVASSILHWKMMLFAGQGVVEFSGANYSVNAWTPVAPYANYVDESIYFTSDAAIVESFMRKFDDSWVDKTMFADYANMMNAPTRRYPFFAISPDMNFPPGSSYTSRSVKLYNAETAGIDVIMYRITQQTHTDAIIAARQRGVPVRLITEPNEYRNPARLWDAWNVDLLWKAGVQIRMRAHLGLNHQKSVLFRGLGTVIFGSSNWSKASDNFQQEHNYFVSNKPWIVTWFDDQFMRKWTNTNPIGAKETRPFTPLPPDTPKYQTPSNGATGVSRGVTLKWYAGSWAHFYDIYFGTSPTPPRIVAGKHLGPSTALIDYKSYSIAGLAAHTTYYWMIVSKTAAGMKASGPVRSFTTGS